MIRDKLIKLAEPHLTLDDVRSVSMGKQGEDVQLSPKARDFFPIQIECKNKEKYTSFYKDYKQAGEHGKHEPVLIIKQNGDKPLAVVDADYLLELVYYRSQNW